MKKELRTQFVKKRLALKGGKPKADYIAACKEKGYIARYCGKELVDEEGTVVREKGFYLTPIN